MKALTEEEDFSLPLTPMIDIVFQLLIFFLLTTTIAEEERDITINLQEASEGAASGAAASQHLVIGVRKDGSFSLGGQVLAWEELNKRLEDAGRRQDKPRVTIRGDREASHGMVVRVYAACIKAGLTQVGVRVLYQQDSGP